MKRYEAMFLFDSAVTREWSAIEQEVRRLLDRIGAELLVCVKFDERRLAFEINKRKRGTYVLTYIDADPAKIQELERDVILSELVLRILVLRAENLTEERLAELKAHPADTPLAPLGDGRRRDDGPGGDDRDRRPRGGYRDRDRDDRSDRPREDTEVAAAPADGAEAPAPAPAEPDAAPGE